MIWSVFLGWFRRIINRSLPSVPLFAMKIALDTGRRSSVDNTPKQHITIRSSLLNEPMRWPWMNAAARCRSSVNERNSLTLPNVWETLLRRVCRIPFSNMGKYTRWIDRKRLPYVREGMPHLQQSVAHSNAFANAGGVNTVNGDGAFITLNSEGTACVHWHSNAALFIAMNVTVDVDRTNNHHGILWSSAKIGVCVIPSRIPFCTTAQRYRTFLTFTLYTTVNFICNSSA